MRYIVTLTMCLLLMSSAIHGSENKNVNLMKGIQYLKNNDLKNAQKMLSKAKNSKDISVSIISEYALILTQIPTPRNSLEDIDIAAVIEDIKSLNGKIFGLDSSNIEKINRNLYMLDFIFPYPSNIYWVEEDSQKTLSSAIIMYYNFALFFADMDSKRYFTNAFVAFNLISNYLKDLDNYLDLKNKLREVEKNKKFTEWPSDVMTN